MEVAKDYRFEGPDGTVGLADLFEGRSQLIVGHFMFDPSWEDGCPSCSAGADEVADGFLEHLHSRDTTMAYVSRAPLAKIEDYKARKGSSTDAHRPHLTFRFVGDDPRRCASWSSTTSPPCARCSRGS